MAKLGWIRLESKVGRYFKKGNNLRETTAWLSSLLSLSPRCVIDCKINNYVSNDHCWPCHPSCSTCNNGTAWSCTQCGVTTAPREGVRQDVYLHRGMCVLTCPSGFYGSNHQCVPCHTSCKYCNGPLKTNCTSCKDGLVRADNGTGLCLDNCPSGKRLF